MYKRSSQATTLSSTRPIEEPAIALLSAKRGAMANLLVRGVDDDIVQALKQAGVDMKKNVVFMGGDDSYVLKAVFD